MVVANWVVGQEVVCPKCGQLGRAGVDVFTAKGRKYRYKTVRHYEGGRVRRCIVGLWTGTGIPAAAAGPSVGSIEKGASVSVPTVPAAVEVPEPPVFRDETPIPEEVDRVSWYITKVSASWGSLRENPSSENLSRFVKTVNQIAQRLGIPAGDLVAAAEYFYKVRSEKAKSVVNEAVKRFVARIVIANTSYFASIPVPVGTETGTEAAREEEAEALREVAGKVEEALVALADLRREVEYVKEQVRQRKGTGARAVVRGERRIEFREGNLYSMIREVMSAGGEWTKEAIVEEIRVRFGKDVSGNSVSGRLSELAAAGFVVGRRQGRTWLWRWVGS